MWAQFLNRSQTKLRTYHIPLDAFQLHNNDLENVDDLETAERSRDAKNSNITLVYEDVSDIWVNVSNFTVFFLIL